MIMTKKPAGKSSTGQYGADSGSEDPSIIQPGRVPGFCATATHFVPRQLFFVPRQLEAKALTALNRDQGHPAVPVIHGVSMRQTWSPVVVLEALYGPTLAEFFASVRTPIKHVAKKKNSGNGRNKAMGGSTVTGGVWTSTPGASSCCQLSCTCMLMAWCIPTSAATQLCSQRVSSPSIGYGFKDKGEDRASFVWV
jgi:hypothetical protein